MFVSYYFQDLIFIFGFNSLIIICVGVNNFMFSLLGICSVSQICRFMWLIIFGQMLAIISLNIFSTLYLFSWYCQCAYMGVLNDTVQFSLLISSLYSSGRIICIAATLSSPILSSATYILCWALLLSLKFQLLDIWTAEFPLISFLLLLSFIFIYFFMKNCHHIFL